MPAERIFTVRLADPDRQALETIRDHLHRERHGTRPSMSAVMRHALLVRALKLQPEPKRWGSRAGSAPADCQPR
jgi:hypothetical protein